MPYHTSAPMAPLIHRSYFGRFHHQTVFTDKGRDLEGKERLKQVCFCANGNNYSSAAEDESFSAAAVSSIPATHVLSTCCTRVSTAVVYSSARPSRFL